jgi:hypothetical protein
MSASETPVCPRVLLPVKTSGAFVARLSMCRLAWVSVVATTAWVLSRACTPLPSFAGLGFLVVAAAALIDNRGTGGRPGLVFGVRCRVAPRGHHSGPFGLTRKRRHNLFAIFAPSPHLHGMPLERGLLQLLEQWG